MNIGVIEIMPKGHFTLVDSVVRIFNSNPENRIYIFTNYNGSQELKSLEANSNGAIKIVLLANDNVKIFLSKVLDFELDLIYITTMEKYFKEFCELSHIKRLNLFIHNIDEWFQVDYRFKIYTFFSGFTLSPKLAYTIKTSFIYPYWREKIIRNIKKNNGKFVVLSSILRNELAKYLPQDNIEIIPFSVYDESLFDNSTNNKMLRVCIPGLLSKFRRDYYSILNMIEDNLELFKDKIQFDFLGGITPEENGDELLVDIRKIIAKGANIIVYNKLRVPLSEFDNQLTKADLILANMKVVLNKYSNYGKTKDSGITFTMIRAAKPGIFISGYPIIEELKSSSMIYDNYVELKNILIELAENKAKLVQFKLEAKKNSRNFTPQNIYKNLAVN